ncbi:MAG: hypothetical protein A4E66_01687 [Syntrophus sp. PtaB.Bin001]|nr:MAG: hypothetical protein A4E66_01687 [Syntrophus sp. PtaB.Bin001]
MFPVEVPAGRFRQSEICGCPPSTSTSRSILSVGRYCPKTREEKLVNRHVWSISRLKSRQERLSIAAAFSKVRDAGRSGRLLIEIAPDEAIRSRSHKNSALVKAL